MISTRRDVLHVLGFLPLLASSASSSSPFRGLTNSDVSALGRYFPQLATMHNGHPLAYLDSAATTLRPRPVLEAMVDFYQSRNANPGHQLHFLATAAADEFDTARVRVAKFINALDPLEIVWTRGTTEALNIVASAWGLVHLRPGDEVILTLAEHASCMLPWQRAAEQTGATIRYVDVDDEGRLRLDILDKFLSQRTKIVCFTHVSNVLGAINPAKEICRRAKQVGARVLIDAAQSVPHMGIDVQAIGCDFAAFSSHKMLGPMGVGILYARREALDEMQVYQSGANMAHARSLTEWEYAAGALRFGAGTPSVADAIGLAAAADFLTALGQSNLWTREQHLTAYAIDQFRTVPGLRIVGPTTADRRVSIFSYVIDGVSTQDIVQKLDRLGICVRTGDLASMPLLQRFELRSAVRASLYIYTTEAEVDRLADTLGRLAQRKDLTK
jgi:cysteine desulfurase/selenocysteine lyase